MIGYFGLSEHLDLHPKGPCTQTVYSLALKHSLYRYMGPKIYSILVRGPLGTGSPISGQSAEVVPSSPSQTRPSTDMELRTCVKTLNRLL